MSDRYARKFLRRAKQALTRQAISRARLQQDFIVCNFIRQLRQIPLLNEIREAGRKTTNHGCTETLARFGTKPRPCRFVQIRKLQGLRGPSVWPWALKNFPK